VLFNLGLGLAGALWSGAAAAAPPSAPDDARGSLALFCADECGELALSDLATSGFSLRARLPLTAARPVVVLSDVTESWPRPDATRLESWGEGDVAGMAGAGEIVLLQWAVPAEEGAARLAELAAAAASAATWVEDADTGRLLGRAEATALADAASGDIDVSALVVVEVHPDGDGATLATAGLHRLGLPELVDTGVPTVDVGARAARLNAVAQAVYEEGLDATVTIDAARFASATARQAACGLSGTATLGLLHGRGAELGPGPKAAIIDFDGGFGDCASDAGQARTDATVATESPAPAPAETTEPAPPAPSPPDTLETVQGAALARLRGPVADAWAAGLPTGDRLMVKAPFQSLDGRVAWLWLQVDAWSDDVLAGPLLSTPPKGVALHEGDTVQAPLDLVFDYLWQHADGSTEGNTTQPFL